MLVIMLACQISSELVYSITLVGLLPPNFTIFHFHHSVVVPHGAETKSNVYITASLPISNDIKVVSEFTGLNGNLAFINITI